MGGLFSSLLASFSARKMELCIVGLDNAGKTTLTNVLAAGDSTEPIPTLGLNARTARKGNVNMKIWDLAGQESYRSEGWGRYARGVDVIVFVVDVADAARLPEARRELHRLLEDTSLASTPILVAANKVDISPHVGESELIKELNLDYLIDNPWVIVPISAKAQTGLDVFLQWLIRQRKGESTRGADSGKVIAGAGLASK